MIFMEKVTKRYLIQDGEPVTALDQVSLTLPETGMIFFLGKSGSGKSTLLHMIGGLDEITDGVIEVNGCPVMELDERERDAYRNTYVGFVFQEDALLHDLSVEENIALSLQLQGRTATKEEIKEVLCRVDLSGYENRRVTELSGGERQRVAIARALVKDPQMILADEPTGALDSKTGKAVFDILKECSKKKLVIVVTHDRESAEQYADRIIELSDGRVIADTQQDGEDTDVLKDVSGKPQLKQSKLLKQTKSRMAWHNICSHKIRFSLLVLLSAVALVLSALFDDLQAFDAQTALSDSIRKNQTYEYPVKKAAKVKDQGKQVWSQDGFLLTDADIDSLNEETGAEFRGVYVPLLESMNITGYYVHDTQEVQDSIFNTKNLNGFMELTEDDMSKLGYRMLAGELPDGTRNEIALTSYVYESFALAGYRSGSQEACRIKDSEGKIVASYLPDEIPNEVLTGAIVEEDGKYPDGMIEVIDSMDKSQSAGDYQDIEKPDDLIGCSLRIAGINYTITGIVDTGFDRTLYEDLDQSASQDALMKLRMDRLQEEKESGMLCLAFIGAGRISELASWYPKVIRADGMNLTITYQGKSVQVHSIARFSDVEEGLLGGTSIRWPVLSFDPETGQTECDVRESLKENEFILPQIYAEDQQERDFRVSDTTSLAPWGGEGSLRDYELFEIRAAYDDHSTTYGGKKFQAVGEMESYYDYLGYRDTLLVSDEFFDQVSEGREGTYAYAVGIAPQDTKSLHRLIKACDNDGADTRYMIAGATGAELAKLTDVIGRLSGYFRYAAILLCVFSIIIFCNFISISVTSRQKDIGILRALGGSGRDIYAIFGLETMFTCFGIFLVSVTGIILAVMIGNRMLQSQMGMTTAILHLGARQILLLLILTVIGGLASGLFPIRRVIRRAPLDAMRTE